MPVSPNHVSYRAGGLDLFPAGLFFALCFVNSRVVVYEVGGELCKSHGGVLQQDFLSSLQVFSG